MTKNCSRCQVEKGIEEFVQNKRYKDGRRGICKPCHSEYMTNYYLRNPEKYAVKLAQANITIPNWKRHKITEESYKGMLAQFDGNCHVCKLRPENSIDHDHTCCDATRSCGDCVRGVLCLQCNTALGLLGDDIKVVQSALDYLS
jgi:hypothetical protein